jgi:hypothetical protein
MIKNDTIAAASPMAILTMAILCMVDENPSWYPPRILFDMKYDRFNLFNFSGSMLFAK